MLVQDAISVIETDCEVDFAPPLDYVEPKREERVPEPARTADGAGQCRHLRGYIERFTPSLIP
jgi:hypothetical protein